MNELTEFNDINDRDEDYSRDRYFDEHLVNKGMWTCIKCGFKFDERTGDIDERMCNDCLNEEYVDGC